MYEGIIVSLIRLFAIITNYKDKKSLEESGMLVESYLSENVDKELVGKYLELYSTLVREYHNEQTGILYENNGHAKDSTSSQLNRICDEINSLYDLETRFLILFQLLNFIRKDNTGTDLELDEVDHIAERLKINDIDYSNLRAFALFSLNDIPDKSQLLIITGEPKSPLVGAKHLFNKNQSIEVDILRIVSINSLIYKYYGSRNLYMNGHKVAQNRVYVFSQGAILKTSRISPIYYRRAMSAFIQKKGKPQIVYTGQDISYKFSRSTYGLHPFSIKEESGNLVGIIGGSGVGKSTLLNALCGNLKLHSGSIKINGRELDEENEEIDGIIGYVPQDDLLIEELTVYENLLYNARLCFGNMSDEDIEKKINKTLRNFDLIEARDLQVGTPLKKILSGGQRKRLNLALELMREPAILMVDEPTSGLSSADSEKVMFLLKKQCLKGKLVFANIHQPSSDIFRLLDRLIVMDKGGRVIYSGNPMDAITYFKNEAQYVNPDESECLTCGNVKTEQPLRIIEARRVDPFGNIIRKRKVSPEEWYETYQQKIEKNIKKKFTRYSTRIRELPKNRFKIPVWFEQFKIFSSRDFASKLKNHQYILIALLEAPILALILGFFVKYRADDSYIFSENNNIIAFLFMSVVVSLFIGLTISAEELFKDRRILKREKFLNLSRGAYLSSKILILFLLSAFQMLTYVIIGNSILEIQGLTFSMWLILFSTSCFANVLGLNLSTGLNSIVTIYILIPLLLIPQLLFSGVIVDFNKMHSSINNITRTPLIGDVMASRWSYEALAVNLYNNNEYRKQLFQEEFEKNKYSFKSFFLIPELKDRLSIIEQASLRQNESVVKDQLKTLENELLFLAKDSLDSQTKDAIEKVGAMKGDRSSFITLNTTLDDLQDVYRSKYALASSNLDSKLELLIEQYGGRESFNKFKNQYNNNNLEEVVKGKFESQRLKEFNNRIYQTNYPIYRAPVYSNGSAHFYAPYKDFFGLKINTVVFNTLVVWLMTGALLLMLYFDILRKLLTYFENMKLLRLSKLRERNT